jgi:ABC-type Fe3+-citrate transport system substrate-binding protein
MKAQAVKKIEKLLESDKDANKKITEFEEILADVESLDQRKMFLWLEIYNNAKNDRVCASALFTQAFKELGGTAAEHSTLGPTLVKYLERMTKANDQLLSLANLVTKEIETQKSLDTDDIFERIEG